MPLAGSWPPRRRAVWDTAERIGAWRSLVARTVRVGEVPSSNLGAPIAALKETVTFVVVNPPRH
jgi:hypothetical protein